MSAANLRLLGATVALSMSTYLVACAGGDAAGPGPTSGAAGTSAAAGTVGGAAGTGTTSGAAGVASAAGTSGGAAGTASETGAAGTSASGAAGTAAPTGAAGSAVAGASGTAGTNGAAGTNGGGAAGAPAPSGPSAGCTKPPSQALATYVRHDIMVTGVDAGYTSRNYYLRLPTNYDPTRKYPTIFLGPGCGGDGKSVLPIQNASMGDAILVGLSPVGQCFKTNGATSPDNPFFLAALKEVEDNACVDKGRVFVAGFSSGSWLANQLGCMYGGTILRGQGNCTGGLPGGLPMCSGPLAAMLAHDEGDTANKIAGGIAARDRILKINGCTGTDTVPYDAGTPSPCVRYTGCPAAYPVVWCQTTGKGHSDQIPISTTGFWKFWSSLP